MIDVLNSVVGKAFSGLIKRGLTAYSDLQVEEKIKERTKEAITEASMRPFSLDLVSKFKDQHLLEEFLAHHQLKDKTKSEAIALFLGDTDDQEAIHFVGKYYDDITRIVTTGRESFAERKTLDNTEEIIDQVSEIRTIVKELNGLDNYTGDSQSHENIVANLTLVLEFHNDSFFLAQSSIETLNDYYKEKHANKVSSCNVTLELRNEEGVITYLERKENFYYRIDTPSPDIFEQYYLRRKKSSLNRLGKAIELLLNKCTDRNTVWLPYYSMLTMEEDCFYKDEDGIIQPLLLVVVWRKTIEEMARELLYGRVNEYINDDKYYSIDVMFHDGNNREITSFIAFLDKEDFEDDPDKWAKIFLYGPDADVFDLPESSRIRLLPDCFLNLVAFRDRNPGTYEEYFGSDEFAFDLLRWSIGPH